jgi:sugar O-acyltransferase (sialic acid O-acetyltransferase NeuD family)
MAEKLCIIGAGGFGREVLGLYEDIMESEKTVSQFDIVFGEEDAIWTERLVNGHSVLPISAIDFNSYDAVIAIGDGKARQRIAKSLEGIAKWTTLIHPTVVMGRRISIGAGSIICAGCILTCDIQLGSHTHLNLVTTIGHDSICGDFLTTAPSAHISGRCTLGNSVYMGTGAMLRDGISIGDNITIGMGAAVLNDLNLAGTYVGIPAQRLR